MEFKDKIMLCCFREVKCKQGSQQGFDKLCNVFRLSRLRVH